jgi:hypothetical protein
VRRQSRAEFVLARRDDLHQFSNRALETLAILDNPNSSPAVLLRTFMFILQRLATSPDSQDRLMHAGTGPRSRRQ